MRCNWCNRHYIFVRLWSPSCKGCKLNVLLLRISFLYTLLLKMVFGNCGVLQSDDLANKGYVEMTTIDAETSQDIAEAINNRMGRYLEAQVSLICAFYSISLMTYILFLVDSRIKVSSGRRNFDYFGCWRTHSLWRMPNLFRSNGSEFILFGYDSWLSIHLTLIINERCYLQEMLVTHLRWTWFCKWWEALHWLDSQRQWH